MNKSTKKNTVCRTPSGPALKPAATAEIIDTKYRFTTAGGVGHNYTREEVYAARHSGTLKFPMSAEEQIAALELDNSTFGWNTHYRNAERRPFMIKRHTFEKDTPECEYWIENILAAAQPFVMAGPSKSLKTSILIDLYLSLASGTPFLGKFLVKKKLTTLLFSLESGASKLENTIKRCLASKGLKKLPSRFILTTQRDMVIDHYTDTEEMSGEIAAQHPDATMLDPVYLGFDTGGREGSLYSQGMLCNKYAHVCGTSQPGLCHHFKSSVPVGHVPQLSDMSYPGLEQWARQWMLLNRRSAFVAGEPHKLILNCGGSEGHGGVYELDIDEGMVNGKLTKWEVTVRDYVPGGKKNTKNKPKLDKDSREFLRKLKAVRGKCTVRKLRNDLLTWNSKKFTRIRKALVTSGHLDPDNLLLTNKGLGI